MFIAPVLNELSWPWPSGLAQKVGRESCERPSNQKGPRRTPWGGPLSVLHSERRQSAVPPSTIIANLGWLPVRGRHSPSRPSIYPPRFRKAGPHGALEDPSVPGRQWLGRGLESGYVQIVSGKLGCGVVSVNSKTVSKRSPINSPRLLFGAGSADRGGLSTLGGSGWHLQLALGCFSDRPTWQASLSEAQSRCLAPRRSPTGKRSAS